MIIRADIHSPMFEYYYTYGHFYHYLGKKFTFIKQLIIYKNILKNYSTYKRYFNIKNLSQY
jgi:hypothetical protein